MTANSRSSRFVSADADGAEFGAMRSYLDLVQKILAGEEAESSAQQAMRLRKALLQWFRASLAGVDRSSVPARQRPLARRWRERSARWRKHWIIGRRARTAIVPPDIVVG